MRDGSLCEKLLYNHLPNSTREERIVSVGVKAWLLKSIPKVTSLIFISGTASTTPTCFDFIPINTNSDVFGLPGAGNWVKTWSACIFRNVTSNLYTISPIFSLRSRSPSHDDRRLLAIPPSKIRLQNLMLNEESYWFVGLIVANVSPISWRPWGLVSLVRKDLLPTFVEMDQPCSAREILKRKGFYLESVS